jgi:hypothetical protein
LEASTSEGVQHSAHVLIGGGWLRYREGRGKRVSREAGPEVGVVRSGRMLMAIPQEHFSVSGGKVRCRGHVDRSGVKVCLGDRMGCRMVSCWSSSGLRVLAAHDHASWGLDLEGVGGGR